MKEMIFFLIPLLITLAKILATSPQAASDPTVQLPLYSRLHNILSLTG
jgi:hypothetical protein